jgi:mercuric ion transport protein
MTIQTESQELRRADATSRSRLGDKTTLLSVGGILAALGAATCCVVPFALFFAGISGAWIGNLTALKPYQPLFVALAVGCLGAGFYFVYRKPKASECVEGSYCARPSSRRMTKIGLWAATVLIIVAVGFPYAARFFLDT